MIRIATKYDIPMLLQMIEKYNAEIAIEKYKDQSLWDRQYISNLLFSLIVGKGFIIIDDEYRGMLLAVITPNVWCPKSYELNEMAWWVEPESRHGTLGGKLWLEFNKQAQKLLDEKRVDVVYTSLMVGSPTIDYSKRGFKLLETKYFRE